MIVVFRPSLWAAAAGPSMCAAQFRSAARQQAPGPGKAAGGDAPPAAGAEETPDDELADEDLSPDFDEPRPLTWSGIDVGSPFDHPRSGILYVARHLPPPGRDGLPEAYLNELRELITAAGGPTLGLFSSMRAARQAPPALRARIQP